MNIVVLFKQVDYIYARTGLDPNKRFVDFFDHRLMNDPLSEAALLEAGKIKSRLGGEIWALFLGKDLIEKEARRALALGADHFVWIYDQGWDELDAWSTAFILSQAAQKLGASIILSGAVSADQNQGEVGFYVAGRLGYPCLSPVSQMEIGADGQILLIRSLGRGRREKLTCPLPLVIGVDRGQREIPYPAHMKMIEAGKKEIILWRGIDLGLDAVSFPYLAGPGPVAAPRPRPRQIPFLNGDLPAMDRIEWLLSAKGRKKGGVKIEGRPEDLAQTLVNFLLEKNLGPVCLNH